MSQLSGKVIRPILKEIIEENLKKVPLDFYIYGDSSNPDCVSYQKSLEKLLNSFSIPYRVSSYNKNKTEEENLLAFKNEIKDSSVLLLRPLPIKNENLFIESIPSSQDPDMLSNINRGILFSGDLSYLPATAKSVMTILKYYHVKVESKNVVVLGRSLSLGLPCFELINGMNGNVSLLHSKSLREDSNEYIKKADVIILATGKTGLICENMIKDGATIIDCGFSYGSGDLGFIPADNALYDYTPVPGGVGSLTSYCLIQNAIFLKAKELGKLDSIKNI